VGNGTLLARADASVTIGTGHVMRCLALAQAWQDAGGRAVFALAQTTPSVEERLQRESMDVVRLKADPGSAEDAQETVLLAREKQAAWVVVDGYCFGADYQAALKRAGLKVLFIDDNGHAEHYSADIVLDQNAHASESSYSSRESCTRLLLGLRYALLRREFGRWREWKREIPALGRKILITMGGSDPDDLTSRAIGVLTEAGIEGLEAIVVVGGSNTHEDSLQRLAMRSGRSIRLITEPSNMPDLIAWADMALIAAGGTLWELLSMGCPVLSYARNPVQAKIISQLSDAGIIRGLGYPQDHSQPLTAAAVVELANSQECRARFCRLARERIDGQGARRVLETLVSRGIGQL